ncbi:hypothetical protein PbB2_02224 [Candidatus Phycosocius bacilliformis]|uniref:TIGR02301 family protein n=1 Tax=Candidatus Phycosocius bacilliformis TaxID=1445552 RepID=A0A2P2EBU6_9PROT|nr:TIGR02301 family protein [Candidatus Phycosocius bacilliformis]GBF58538.1 hypothetical protein PbB2_02224 [Candidatus Phycosocius bacilliformis]
MRKAVWISVIIGAAAVSAAALSFAQTAYPAGQAPVELEYGDPSRGEAGSRLPPAEAPEDAAVADPGDFPADWDPASQGLNAGETVSSRNASQSRKSLRDVDANTSGTNPAVTMADEQVMRDPRRPRAVDPKTKADLQQMSRILGSLHALRVSCTGREDQTYRSRMATMLDLEAADDSPLRDPLVDAFNEGFQAYGQGVATCPRDQTAQEARLAKEGYGLAKKLAAQYRAIGLPPTQPAPGAVPTSSAGR